MSLLLHYLSPTSAGGLFSDDLGKFLMLIFFIDALRKFKMGILLFDTLKMILLQPLHSIHAALLWRTFLLLCQCTGHIS